MIHQNTIYTAGIETKEQVSQLTERISNMIGVHQVNINIIDGQVTVSYETPANLNSIEKEIYDEGNCILGYNVECAIDFNFENKLKIL